MTTIATPSLSTFTAADLMEGLYKPNISTPDSLEVINGWLSKLNFPAGTKFNRDHVQSDAFVVGGQVAGNGPLDYFDDAFSGDRCFPSGGLLGEDPDDVEAPDWLPIPGANASFFLPWRPRLVWFTWNVTWLCDSKDTANNAAAIRFGLKGSGVAGTPSFYASARRVCPYSVKDTHSSNNFWFERLQNHWSGHKVVAWPEVQEYGWFNAGLYIKTSTPHARVFNRSFRWIALRGQ